MGISSVGSAKCGALVSIGLFLVSPGSRAVAADTCEAPLSLVDTAPGMIEDFDPQRILFRSAAGVVSLIDRQTRAVTEIATEPMFRWGRLGPGVALYVYGRLDAAFNETDYPTALWQDGQLRRITTYIGLQYETTVVRGEFALFGRGLITGGGTMLHRLDLRDGSEQDVPLVGGSEGSLAPNGDVIGRPITDTTPCCSALWRFRGGATEQLFTWPVSTPVGVIGFDGTTLAYLTGANGSIPAIHDGNAEQRLTTFSNTRHSFSFSNGWAAYQDIDASNQPLGFPQVWRRYPDGRLEQASDLANGSVLIPTIDVRMPELGDDVAPNGEIVLQVYTGGSVRFLSRPGIPTPISLGPSSLDGRFWWRDGTWYLTHGTALCAFEPPAMPLPDAGAETGSNDSGDAANDSGDAANDSGAGNPADAAVDQATATDGDAPADAQAAMDAAAPRSTPRDSGCGCTVAVSASSDGWPMMMFAALLIGVWRSRPSRRSILRTAARPPLFE